MITVSPLFIHVTHIHKLITSYIYGVKCQPVVIWDSWIYIYIKPIPDIDDFVASVLPTYYSYHRPVFIAI